MKLIIREQCIVNFFLDNLLIIGKSFSLMNVKIIKRKIHVHVSHIISVPARFDEMEKNYTVIKGQNKTMDCQAIGDQPLSVTWSFNSQTLSSAGMTRCV